MQVSSTNSTSANTPTTSGSNAKDMNDMFMTLLVAQLKSQDPTSPMDPTQFVGQLVQFNSLNELIKIREVLQGVTTDPVVPAGDAGGR
jgi:flagellar basal-body rod modification protein FlgD